MRQRAELAGAVIAGTVLVASVRGAAVRRSPCPRRSSRRTRQPSNTPSTVWRTAPGPATSSTCRPSGSPTWIDQQLHPDGIDDSALKARLPEQPERPTATTDQKEMRQWGRQSVQALSQEKVVRAVYSERQLEEQLVDFWFNHFNVFAGKGRTSEWIVDYERTRSARTCSANSATCWKLRQRARRCSSIWITG